MLKSVKKLDFYRQKVLQKIHIFTDRFKRTRGRNKPPPYNPGRFVIRGASGAQALVRLCVHDIFRVIFRTI